MMRNRFRLPAISLFPLIFIFVLCFATQARGTDQIAGTHSLNPWSQTQITPAGDLAAQVERKSGAKPVILQIGFAVLYRSEHIPGAIYAGPASTAEGLQMLKQTAAKFPKTSDIYLYCGCCPMDKCPNIRPAFEALQSMGFTHLHVVMLETSFGKDWVAHGYPIAGAQAPIN